MSRWGGVDLSSFSLSDPPNNDVLLVDIHVLNLYIRPACTGIVLLRN